MNVQRYALNALARASLLWLALAAASVVRAESFACAAEGVSALPPTDSDAAVSLVCAELRRLTLESGEFSVSLTAHGDRLELAVRDRKSGRSRAVVVDTLADIVAFAPRLAVALVTDQALAVRRIPSAARERARDERKTRVKLTLGGHTRLAGRVLEPGPLFAIAVEKPDGGLAVVGEASVAPGFRLNPSFGMSSLQGALSLGGRFRLAGHGDGVFLGVGVSLLGQRCQARDKETTDPKAWGPGMYVELGLPLNPRGTVTLRARLDVPFFAVTHRNAGSALFGPGVTPVGPYVRLGPTITEGRYAGYTPALYEYTWAETEYLLSFGVTVRIR